MSVIRSTKEPVSAVAVALVALGATLMSSVAGADDAIPANEYVTLPKFCWPQFSGGRVPASGPEFQFLNCGPRVNHYCYGLLDLQRSKIAKSMDERRRLLTNARTHTLYTLNGLKLEGTMATCSVTSHVQATMRDVDLQMQIYNIK